MTKRNALLSFERLKHEIERRKMLEEIPKIVQAERKFKKKG